MKIAILLSTYNGELYLREQLNSIAKQTLINDIEVFIRDDGSKDSTIKIINEFRKNLKIHLKQGENTGASKSFWDLLFDEAIQADYFAFCDQDDIWYPNKIEKQISYLEKDVNISTCNCRYINKTGEVLMDKRSFDPNTMQLPAIFACGFTQGCAMVFTKKFRDFMLSLSIKTIPMHDWVIQMYATALDWKIKWHDEPLFDYRIHENNVVAKNNKGFIKNITTTYRNWKFTAKSSLEDVAKEMLLNLNDIDEINEKYLEYLSTYKKNIQSKKELFFSPYINCLNKKIKRSYRIKLLLNLL